MKNFYIHYKTIDDGPTGYPEEYEGYVGPFENEKIAYQAMEKMDNEYWLSGQNTYYDTYVIRK